MILNAAARPELYVIQDPAASLQPEERVEVHYLVRAGDITGIGDDPLPRPPRRGRFAQ